ncbi:MAG: hypothetical protein LBT31_02095 [Synergistaceae bacterium]|jgi:hypothetical protein|nr:hypothetical protein [Synergistaceae bacterium]
MRFGINNDASRTRVSVSHSRSLLRSLVAFSVFSLFALCSITSAFADPYFPGSGTIGDPFQIEDDDHLVLLSDLVNSADANPTYAPAYYVLNSDISFDDTDSWTPIGISDALLFGGSFDGANHNITGLSIDVRAEYQGVFGYVSGKGDSNLASVKNLNVTVANINGGRYVGGIAGWASYASIENCDIFGVVSSDVRNSDVGGIVGYVNNDTTITECSSYATVKGSGYYVGGIVGYVVSGGITSCDNTGIVIGVGSVGGIVGETSSNVNILYCDSSASVTGTDNYTGGIAGYIHDTGSIVSSDNTGTITGTSYVGGIAGYAYDTINIAGCYNSADITGTADNIGGVAGRVDLRSNITSVYSRGTVSGRGTVGGIAGNTYSGSLIEKSQNDSFVSGTFDNVGGVTGNLYSSTISNCFNTGDVNSATVALRGDNDGGIVGTAQGSSVQNCYSTGTVYGKSYVGGISGYLYSSTLENCVALNISVVRTGSNSGRVSGYPTSGSYQNCYGYDEMSYGTLPFSGGYGGIDVSAAEAAQATFWTTTAGWSEDIWDIEDDELPQLKNLPLPSGTDVVQVIRIPEDWPPQDEDSDEMGIGWE